MGGDLNSALRQFEVSEANLAKLERLWGQIAEILDRLEGRSSSSSDQDEYEGRAGAFRRILSSMPKIDGYVLVDAVEDYGTALSHCIDAMQVDEPECWVHLHDEFHAQGRLLAEYRARFDTKRRELARPSIERLCTEIDVIVAQLPSLTEGMAGSSPVASAAADEWLRLKERVSAVRVLLGSSSVRVDRWGDLLRHLRFGLRCDADDIVQDDWPAVKASLARALYSEDDPLPVEVEDIGLLVASEPSGPVTTELEWENLSAEDFERLIYNLISSTDGYEKPEWLTRTNAPDQGRDLSVSRVQEDPLGGPRRLRVVIACRHWLSRSTSIDEASSLKAKMRLWGRPRVDVLVIATSGRFTSDAVRWIEEHDQSDEALHIEMWPNSHLEMLLAKRLDLIAEFGLRG